MKKDTISGQKRETDFEQLADAIPHMVWTIELDGRISFINKKWHDWSGLTLKQINKGGWKKIFHPEDAPKLEKEWRDAFQNRRDFDWEYRIINSERKYEWFVGTTTIIKDHEGNPVKFIGTATNINERKKAEEGLYKLAAIVESSEDAIVSKTLDGIIRSWNKSAERLFGWKDHEAIGKPITLIIPRELISEEKEIIRNLKQGIRIEHFETTRLKKDGTPVNVSLTISPVKDNKGNIIGASKIARDISEKIRNKEKLEYYARISDSISDAVITTGNNYTIQSWNKGAQKLYGWKENEVVGKYILDVIPTVFPFKLNDKVWERIFNTDSGWKGEIVQERKNGMEINIRSSVSPLKNFKGEFIGHVIVNQDITDQKKLEERKDDFIALASHELKTPVTSLKMLTELLYRKFKNKGREDILTPLDSMNRQLTRLSILINGLLDVSRAQKGKLKYSKQIFPIRRLIEETVENVKPIIKTHNLELAGLTDDMVYADKERIGQVLINLINNAAKYSPGQDKIMISSERKDNHVIVTVRDFGIGIPEEEQDKLFNRFYQASHSSGKTYPGLGLGLYIAREIINRHKGKIWMDSVLNKGTKFYFSLPVKDK